MTFRPYNPGRPRLPGFCFFSGSTMFTRTFDKLIATIPARRNVGTARVRLCSGRPIPS